MANNDSKRLFLDLDYCIGCKSCAAACTYVHPVQAQEQLVMEDFEGEAILPFICRHCEEPACMAACPVEAISRDESGAVLRSNMLCVGCLSCAYACPFGVISEVRSVHIISKCDLCIGYRRDDQQPACVSACPAGALRFCSMQEITSTGKLFMVGARAFARSPFRHR